MQKPNLLLWAIGLLSLPLISSAQNHPYLQVHDVRQVSAANLANCHDTSAYHLDTVTVIGYVVTDGGLSEIQSSSVVGAGGIRPVLFINDTANFGAVGPFSGLQVMGVNHNTNQATAGITSLKSGELVEITGVVHSFNNSTQLQPLNNSAINILPAAPQKIDPIDVSVADLNDQNKINQLTTGEKWEGAFVELKNVTVTSVNSFGSGSQARTSFVVSDSAGNKIEIGDFFVAQRHLAHQTTNPNTPFDHGVFFNPPTVGTAFASLKGVVEHSGNGCTGNPGVGYRLHPFKMAHYDLAICRAPKNLRPFRSYNTSVSFTWPAGTGTMWAVEFGPSGFTPGDGSEGYYHSNLAGPSNLTPGTCHDFYVRTVCGWDTSARSEVITMCTDCSPVPSLPFTETWESTSTTKDCWRNAMPWSEESPGAFGGSSTSLSFHFSGRSSGSYIAESPAFPKPGPNYQLSFDYAYATNTTENDTLEIVFSYSSNYNVLSTLAGGANSPLSTAPPVGDRSINFVPSSSQWKTHYVAIPPDAVHLGLRAISNWGNRLYIDNFSIEPAPLCNAGTDTAIAVCVHDAAIDVSSYLGSYDSGGTFYDDDSSGALSNSIFDPAMLVAGASYDITYVVIDESCVDSATVSILVEDIPNAGVDMRDTICGLTGVVDLDTMLAAGVTPNGNWTDLTANTVYNGSFLNSGTVVSDKEYVLQYVVSTSACGGDTALFHLYVKDCTNAGLDEFRRNDFSVFPNPTKSSVFIESFFGSPAETIEIYSLSGQLIISNSSRTARTELALTNIPAGIYCVKISTEEGVEVHRITKQ